MSSQQPSEVKRLTKTEKRKAKNEILAENDLVAFFKARKYRIYPNERQVEILTMWEQCLTALWNDGVRALNWNQRLWRAGYAKPFMPTRGHLRRVWMATKAVDSESDFIRLPSQIVDSISARFDQAINDYFKGKGKPKRKDWEEFPPSFTFGVFKSGSGKAFRASDGVAFSMAVVFNKTRIKFPNPSAKKDWGLGPVRYVKHAKLKGEPKTATILREGDKWFCSVACEITARKRAVSDQAVGIDMGVTSHVMTSAPENPEYFFFTPEQKAKKTNRIKKLQRGMSRAQKTSQRRRKIKRELSRIHAKVAASKRAKAHEVANGFMKFKLVAVEKLKVANMTKSAKGTVENPGKNVKAKSGLNREILEVAPYQFRTILASKIARTKGIYVEIDPRFTSQECSECGNINTANRNGKRFKCVECGCELDADINAARNIERRGCIAAGLPVSLDRRQVSLATSRSPARNTRGSNAKHRTVSASQDANINHKKGDVSVLGSSTPRKPQKFSAETTKNRGASDGLS